MKKFILSPLFLISIICLSFKSEKNAPLWLRYPSISPDGKNIVFCYKGDIYKVDAAGGNASPIPHFGYSHILAEHSFFWLLAKSWIIFKVRGCKGKTVFQSDFSEASIKPNKIDFSLSLSSVLAFL